jgi:hypothetical protein
MVAERRLLAGRFAECKDAISVAEAAAIYCDADELESLIDRWERSSTVKTSSEQSVGDMCYKGNFVSHIHHQAAECREIIRRAWHVLEANGYSAFKSKTSPDTLADVIAHVFHDKNAQ